MFTLTKPLIKIYCTLLLLPLVLSCGKSSKNDPAPVLSSAKIITSFTFGSLSPIVTGSISGTTITATVPAGTDVTKLIPTIAVSEKATLSPASGTAQDFTKSVSYTVKAEDGSTQIYTVTITKGKSADKAITAFALKSLNPAVNATIDETTKTINATVPYGTVLTSLVPTVTVSAKATISPTSGLAQDFSKNVTYTVTAEDGSKQTYTASFKVAAATSLVIDCNNIPATLTDRGDGVDYIIGCNIKIGSGTLTVNPGVTIEFDGAASGFTIGGTGALKMVGTSTKPIVLQGKATAPGSWTGIIIDSKNLDNQWQYVTLKDAGAGTNAAGLLISDDAYFLHTTQISIKNCTFSGNTGYGIWDQDNNFGYTHTAFVDFESNTFINNSNAPLNILMDDIGKLDTKSTYTGNGQSYFEVHSTGGLHANTIVPKLTIPYLVVGSIGIYQRLNISPGVTFQFYTDAGFNLDNQYYGAGTFIANGTAANPIKFVGYKSGKGIWLGLSLGNNDPEVLLNYCVIDGAGSNKPNGSSCIGNVKSAVNFYPSCNSWTNNPVATNCTISNCGGYGIVYKKVATVSFTGNIYSNNTQINEQAF